MVNCKICNVECNNVRKLSWHIRNTHECTPKDYYDKFLKTENEGLCGKCGSPTNFENITRGYRPSCSTKCSNNLDTRIDKIIKTKTEKYGEDWAAIYNKQRATVASWSQERTNEYRKNVSMGVKAAHLLDTGLGAKKVETRKSRITSKEWSDKCRAGHLARTTDQIHQANIKRKNTELAKYGVESHTQLASHKKFAKERNIARSAEEKQKIINQVIQTKLNSGYLLPLDHPDRQSKKEYKNKVRAQSEIWAKLTFSESELAMRGLNGTPGAVQLDHIVSLETCYRQRIPIEIASHCVNLRLITWQENIKKKTTDHMTVQELTEEFNKYDNTKHLT